MLGAVGRAEGEEEAPVGVAVGDLARVHDDRLRAALTLDGDQLIGDVADGLVPTDTLELPLAALADRIVGYLMRLGL